MNNLRYSAPIIVTIWTFILMSNTAFAQYSYRTDLVGESQVPPIFSESYGSALVFGNDSSLTYQINVTSLDKVTGAFLYKGEKEEKGQVLVSLLNSTEPSGVINGTLVEGTINSSSILVPLANLTTNLTSAMPAANNLTTNLTSAMPAANNLTTNLTSAMPAANNLTTNLTSAMPAPAPASKLASLIDLMNQNMTHINIHTSKFPEGELRGTLINSIK